MAELDDLDSTIERYHQADREIIRGTAEPYKTVYSHREDATLANPFGGVWRGWKQVSEALDRAASVYRDGQFTAIENLAKHVTPDLAYMVEIERYSAKVAGSAKVSQLALRTTSILRREDGEWKVVHRHADPRTGPQTPESLMS
jgi:ketosteroid isomerase-like protein